MIIHELQKVNVEKGLDILYDLDSLKTVNTSKVIYVIIDSMIDLVEKQTNQEYKRYIKRV
nr:MAG TPA: hypothetical protein [Bacteriophage sp.]